MSRPWMTGWPRQSGDGLLQHGVSSDDPGYNGLAVGTMLVRIADNDVAGLAVGPPAQAVVVEGQRTTYAVALRSQPTGSVQRERGHRWPHQRIAVHADLRRRQLEPGADCDADRDR